MLVCYMAYKRFLDSKSDFPCISFLYYFLLEKSIFPCWFIEEISFLVFIIKFFEILCPWISHRNLISYSNFWFLLIKKIKLLGIEVLKLMSVMY